LIDSPLELVGIFHSRPLGANQPEHYDLALRDKSQRLDVANAAPVLIWMSGTDSFCDYFNDPWLQFTGRSLDQELGNGWAEGVHPEDLQRCLEMYMAAFDRRESFEMEYRLRRHDGQYRWVYDKGVPRLNSNGGFAGFIGACTDITEHKLAEEALSSVSGRLIEAQDQERARIARELHDDISQRLALVAMDLDSQKQDPLVTQGLQAAIGATYKQISDLVSDIHAMSHRLHSSKLDSLGLAAAATGFCRELSERQKVLIDFSSEGIPKKVPEAISLCLFRVLQEALQNALKHGGAKQFRVSLVGSMSEIEMTVWDKGCGFDADHVLMGTGLGLASMKERLKAVGGELSLDTQLKRGTTVHARVPLRPRSRAASAATEGSHLD
jgi:PAS domain S-box-containing protein